MMRDNGKLSNRFHVSTVTLSGAIKDCIMHDEEKQEEVG